MNCKDPQSALAEIRAYCDRESLGHALLVNAESFDVYQDIRQELQADPHKTCIHVCENCPENGLPNLEDVLEKIAEPGDYVLLGFSQAALLLDEKRAAEKIRELLSPSVYGHAVILLEHCERYLKPLLYLRPDNQRWIVLVDGMPSPLARIRLAKTATEAFDATPLPNMKALLQYLENLTDERAGQEITVLTNFSPQTFGGARYMVSPAPGAFERLQKMSKEIDKYTEESYGTPEQWRFLAEKLQESGSLQSLAENSFGGVGNLASSLGEVYEEGDPARSWLLWLCMKALGVPGNAYLREVLQNDESVEDLLFHIYMDILNHTHDEEDFGRLYTERSRLLEDCLENRVLEDKFLDGARYFGKDEVWYLRDENEGEQLEFLKCMENYDYTETELYEITRRGFPELYLYLQPFVFDKMNTELPSTAAHLWEEFTTYFAQYKIQKLLNRIFPEHLKRVEAYADTRPYNMVPPRSKVLRGLDRTGAQLYFFDALGVEYLAYILKKCESYGILAEVSVARCQLPSITSMNKDFLDFFPGGARDIKDLDELKHHSLAIDYQQCKEPIHLFRELEIIDGELQKIADALRGERFQKAFLVADHGASRLAVIHEGEAPLELEEKGQHSGRCCPAPEDPHLPFVAYENGFAVLANYDRFKGGRRANVEVHGGASLEEVLVPIVVLSLMPKDILVRFVEALIILKGREPASIVVYANIPLKQPRLLVNGTYYEGTLENDLRHARFVMPELRRSGTFLADFYDGSRKLAGDMEFRVQRGGTVERDLFGKK